MSNRKNNNLQNSEDELSTNYEVQIDIGGLPLPISFKGNGDIHEQEAINLGIKTFVDSIGQFFQIQYKILKSSCQMRSK